MTVTDQQENSIPKGKSKRQRWLLLALLAVFLAPAIAPWLWTPDSFRNKGDLVEPPRALSSVVLASADGASVELKSLFGKWTYVYFISGACDAQCQQVIGSLERVRIAQGKNARRLRLLLIPLLPEQLSAVSQVRLDLPEAVVLGVSAEEKDSLVSQFLLDSGSPLTGELRIYLVDPLGNLMMSYPIDADPSDLSKDIGRLLRASHIG